MSAYISLPTPMTQTRHLVGALKKLGFSEIEVHEEPVALVGYEGRERRNRAQVIIPRQAIGTFANDLKFVRAPTGFRLIVSSFDGRRFNREWLAQVRQHYLQLEREETERIRLEDEARRRAEEVRQAEERRKLVEARRQEIIAKAKKRGYRIEEQREGERIRLVLRRRVYR